MIDDLRVVRIRGGIRETEHRVQAAVWAADRLVVATGRADRTVFLRSAAKPVQAMACLLTGAAERFGWTEREIAVACASHNAEAKHLEIVRRMLESAGRTEADLHCGPHPPIDESSAHALVRAAAAPRPIHNNCSGKHAAMIAACVAAGWPVEGYADPAHPLQTLNRENVESVAGCPAALVERAVDGCGAPAFAVPLAHAARWAASLASPEAVWAAGERRAALETTTAAMRAHPFLVAGTRRIDTDLMRAADGDVVSKVGAEGVWCVGVRGRRLGLVVKCRDGSSPDAQRAGLALLVALRALPSTAGLERYVDPVLRNHADDDVGRIAVEIPESLQARLAPEVLS